LTQAGEVRKHEVQQARFVVLKSPDHSLDAGRDRLYFKPTKEQRLRTFTHQARLAAAIHKACTTISTPIRRWARASRSWGGRLAAASGCDAANTGGAGD